MSESQTQQLEMTDLAIAGRATLKPIVEIASAAGIDEDDLELYGKYKAKVDVFRKKAGEANQGKIVLVTAMSPTPAGEGKSTTTVGLGDALALEGQRVVIALREPSLGPIFGIKGGAAGGGYAQVLPMEDINMHFTGDFHAITSAHNLLAALMDNHIHQGNALNIDPRRIQFRRVMDMNDRALRDVVIGLGGPTEGVPRESGFDITVASEVMAIFCLATSIDDLRERLSKITVAYTYDRKPVTAGDLNAQGSMTMLLKDALKPNLVQTIQGTPAFVHGGPFANIAHGCNSILATNTAREYADIVVTEAGFGADLGAEKFMNIKSRFGGLGPDAAVVVATIRALKMHGGVPKTELGQANAQAIRNGFANLKRHIGNIRKFGIEPIVALNRFTSDTDEELAIVEELVRAEGAEVAIANMWAEGGEGGRDLARKVIQAVEKPSNFHHLYDLDLSIEDKIATIVKEIYGGSGVEFSAAAKKRLEEINDNGWSNMPVCMAKTQYSFSDDAAKLGAPTDFTISIRDLQVRTGAGFIVAITGAIMTMPGLPKEPAALRMDVGDDGKAIGLF
ncbi:formate--tetrahydrofolate ligase [Neomicrococcus lactis]|uniref:Formate--tetrahydrofolate ligase n=2 Tax=Neomicrococcus lactis TaxID=732241 RepID=A0A7W8YCA4_9MICC|nr:formate--tetrahydrofolate ligase [Neomicrococcus lactis]